MNTYKYSVYQRCITETMDSYSVQAESKEEADEMIRKYTDKSLREKERIESGDSYNESICNIETDMDWVWECLQATDDKPYIVDEDSNEINE